MACSGKNPSESIDKIVETNKPANTLKTEQYVWRQFEQFCQERNYELNFDTSNAELAEILKDWAYNMKKNDGTEYKESVVKTMWNVTAKMLQTKYFKDFNRTFDPFKDAVFQNAVLAKNAKRRILQAIPEKRKVSAATLNYEDIPKVLDTLDEDTPAGLQRKFYHLATVDLGWRVGEAVACILDYFKEEIDDCGLKTGRIEYNTEFPTRSIEKTAVERAPLTVKKEEIDESEPDRIQYKTVLIEPSTPVENSTDDRKFLTPNTSNQENCPVRLWKKLSSKRSKNITTNRLFLTVSKDWNKYPNSIWYKNLPLGKNEINKWRRLGAESVSPKKIKTDLSNTVSQLPSASTSMQDIKSTSENAKQLKEVHNNRTISNIKSEEPSITTLVSGNDQSEESAILASALPSGNVYNNCTFIINKQ